VFLLCFFCVFYFMVKQAAADAPHEVAAGVIMGSTYKVVSCACAKDRSLADESEWCSWCRCRTCGGKHLPPLRSRFHTFQEDAAVAASLRGFSLEALQDFSLDLLPVLGLYGVVWFALQAVETRPTMYLYALGAAAVVFVVRDAFFSFRKIVTV
jgi:hypothetical protein